LTEKPIDITHFLIKSYNTTRTKQKERQMPLFFVYMAKEMTPKRVSFLCFWVVVSL